MGRIPCSRQVIRLNRGPWTPDEDLLLTKYVQTHGEGRWRSLSKKAGLLRSGKSCRLRWMNYLRPDVKRGHILPDEEDLILRLHRLLGNRWSLIAGRLPGRTDNDIKNYWNCHLSKKLISEGIDPRTHRPLSESEDIWWNPQESDIEEKIIRYTTSEDNANPETNGKDSDFLRPNHTKDEICSSMPAPEISCSQNAPTILHSATHEEAAYIEKSKSNCCENLKRITDGSSFPYYFPATPMGTSYGNVNSYTYDSFLESFINEKVEVVEAAVGFNSASHPFLHHSTFESPDYEWWSGLHSPTAQYNRSH